jgi:cyanophycin synthetase
MATLTRTLIQEEALRRGWRVETVGPKGRFLKVILPDGRWNLFQGSTPLQTSAHGKLICQQKNLTMDYLRSLGYDVPGFAVVETVQQASDFLKQYQEIVLKPVDGWQTEGVTVHIIDPATVPQAFAYAKRYSGSGRVIAQQQLTGKLYRLLVINGTLVAAAWRRAAAVTGDGKSTVAELIAKVNQDPRRQGDRALLGPINPEAAATFLGERYTSTPAAGEQVIVSSIDSLSVGGESSNVTGQVHQSWRDFTEQVALQAGVFIAGYDVICEDIAAPLEGNYVPLLEINSSPGFKTHEYSANGVPPIHPAPLLLDAAFEI